MGSDPAGLVRSGSASGRVDPLGALLGLLAGLAYAAYTLLAKQQLEAGHAPATVLAAAFGPGGLLSVPLLLSQPGGSGRRRRGCPAVFAAGGRRWRFGRC